jgi:hypothetical protein
MVPVMIASVLYQLKVQKWSFHLVCHSHYFRTHQLFDLETLTLFYEKYAAKFVQAFYDSVGIF